MRQAIRRLAVGSAAAALVLPMVVGASTPAGASAPPSTASSSATQSVIIVLRDQFAGVPATRSDVRARTAVVDRSQSDVMSGLAADHASHVHRLHLLNAVIANVPADRLAALRDQPGVAEVVPNSVITLPAAMRPTREQAAASEASLAPGVCPSPGKVQLNPEGVELVHAVSENPHGQTARALGYTGAGVTVGDLAVGIDPDALELTRPDGQPVIKDYKDFTGEGTAPEGGEDLESYLDDSLLAAQGRKVYDLHDYTKDMPKGCDIRLQGIAPGITLDAYKIYGNDDQTTTSAFLEGIDYAVDTDHVNVLNEEGGEFPFPDTARNLIWTANAAAMAAGVTITSPSYDAGPQSTIWSPSTQPGVISAGASTGFRVYAQADIGEYDRMHAHGWVSDNISALSSGGSSELGHGIDVVAPGDLDWILCVKGTVACGDTDLTIEGGTSESGPIVAGVAALVYQAYRGTHHGANPSPALVRNILSSTATDLNSPASEQGSGLVNAYRAVLAARSVGLPHTGHSGAQLVADTQQLSAVGRPGARFARRVQITNDGTAPAHVTTGARVMGRPELVASRTVRFASKTSGDRIFRFRLRHRVDQLTATLAYPGKQNPNALSLSLVEPNGKFAGFTLPQGTGNHGWTDVHDAPAGVWEADVSNAAGPYVGPASVQVLGADMRPVGRVSPARLTLPAGHSATITLHGTLPTSPGDGSESLTFGSRGSGRATLPVTTRALVELKRGTGHFHGTLIGGNGRGEVPAQTFFYQVDVPSGQPALDVSTLLGSHARDDYSSFLVDPAGNAVAFASNQVIVGESSTGPVTTAESGAQLHVRRPAAGRWTVIVTFSNPVTGNRQQTPLSGTISTSAFRVRTERLPDSTRTELTGGHQHIVRVIVRNTSDATEAYFLDARLDHSATLALPSLTGQSTVTLPLSDTAAYPSYLVPTHTTSVTGSVSSTAPVLFDMEPANGDPDVEGVRDGDTATATVTGTPVSQGTWTLTPNLVGPFTSAAPRARTTLSMRVRTAAFDPGASANTGDLWEQTATAPTFAPVLVSPGQTATLYLNLDPIASRAARAVHGVVYVDESSAFSQGFAIASGNELAAVPYAYTVRARG